MSSMMRINVWLVRASQFLRLFHLIVRHKSEKEHIIWDVLSRSANTNNSGHDSEYAKFDVLFYYNMILVQINPDLAKHILDGYISDEWWSKIRKQMLDYKKLGVDKALLPFILAGAKFSNSDPYFQPRPKHSNDKTL